MDDQPNFENLLGLLVKHQVAIAVVGAVAMNLRMADNVTLDLDICYERSQENCERLCRALAPHCSLIRSAFMDMVNLLMANARSEVLQTDFGKLDLLGEVAGLGDYAAVRQFATPVPLGDLQVEALTLDGLIKAKEAANRPKDQQHLITLRALKEMEERGDA
jgi:hypothetical protein